jgi:hypothetical protein
MKMKNIIACMCLALASCQPAIAADTEQHCDIYTGLLRQEWPLYGEIQYQGTLFDFKKTEFAVSFEFPPSTIVMPRDALIYANFNHHQCTFEIAYNADPIFHDGFEGSGCDHDDD